MRAPVPFENTERVYFISNGEAIKIGKGKSPLHRLMDMQVGSSRELKLVRVVDGPDGLEQLLHRRFEADRIRGEWFRCSPALLKLVHCRTDWAIRRVHGWWRGFDWLAWAEAQGARAYAPKDESFVSDSLTPKPDFVSRTP